MRIFLLFTMIICACNLTGCKNNDLSAKLTKDNLMNQESNERIYDANELSLESTENSRVREEYIAKSPTLSSYSSKILTSDDNRYNNIKIVSDRLNGYVLEPNAEFSFNNVCGPYGKDDGFLEATILLSDGTESKGYGGGVCQLSSTLYNAVEMLDLEITEHHHHSTPVAYVPKDKDATVSLQSNLDFKFKNTLNYPIRFKTEYTPDQLTVTLSRNE